MHKPRARAAAHKAWRAALVTTALLAATSLQAVRAQSTAPAAAADGAPSEAARRAAASPYRFILLNANAPQRKASPPPAPAAAAATPEPKKPAPPTEQVAAKPVTAPQAPAPAAVAMQAPLPFAAPASAPPATPVAVALPRAPEPPPVVAVQRELVPIHTDPPRLSAALLREQPVGTVRVQFEVQTDGSVGDVKVVASTNRTLNRATVDAVKGWKFEKLDEAQDVETELVYNYKAD